MNIGQYLQGICTTTNLLIRVVLNFGRTSPLCYRMLSSKITVPAPMGIRIRIMARTVTSGLSMVRTAAHFMPIRTGMCMDAGPVTGKRDAVFMDKAALHGWGNGRGTEYLLEKLFVIKREFIPGNSFPSHNFCNVRMAVRKFFSFSRLLAGFLFLSAGKRSFPADFWNCLSWSQRRSIKS